MYFCTLSFAQMTGTANAHMPHLPIYAGQPHPVATKKLNDLHVEFLPLAMGPMRWVNVSKHPWSPVFFLMFWQFFFGIINANDPS